MKNFTKLIAFFFILVVALPARGQRVTNLHEIDSVLLIARAHQPLLQKNKITFSPKPGLISKQKPPAQNRITSTQMSFCPDTSQRFFLVNPDSLGFFTSYVLKASDGNYLLSGECIDYKDPPYKNKGFLLKTDEKGNVLWAKTYDSSASAHQDYINYYQILELKDGGFLLAGSTKNKQTENDDLILTKTDNTGNITWSKIYRSRIWKNGDGSADYYYVQQMKEDIATGDVYICGPFWFEGRNLIKVNSSNGVIAWSNLYQYSNDGYQIFDIPFGVDVRKNDIVYFGKFNAIGHTFISIHRIDKTTGDTLQTKVFKINDPAGYKLEFLTPFNVTVLNNGNYALSGNCYGYYPTGQYDGSTPLYQAAVVELDNNLNFARAYCFRNYTETNNGLINLTVLPDGTGVFENSISMAANSSTYNIVQFRDAQITKQRRKSYPGETILHNNFSTKMADGGDMLVRSLWDSAYNYYKVEFLKLHASDTGSVCLGLDDNSTSVYNFQYVPSSYPFDSIGRNVFQENPNKTLVVENSNLIKNPGCFIISHCDTLKLNASATKICLGQTLTITTVKNKECGSSIPLKYDSTGVTATEINDSTTSFQFSKPWSGYIYASLMGCKLMKDSVHVDVLQAPAALNLGPDTVICPNNTVKINAHSGYATYLWQNGSTDSTFVATNPGTYYVTTTDACGSIFHDTLVVSAHAPVPIDIGPDRTKCNNDTLHLNAPPGFLNYTWSNNYNINATTSQNVVVNPGVDTSYYIQAEKIPGCFAYDTVHISVFHSPPINLGADKSFCFGDSAVFNAGSGFSQYLWSNGSTSQQITIKIPGSYSVTGITANGCKSFDTAQVLNVFPNPVVQLDHTSTLCTGSTRILNAGNYASYLWQDGSTGNTFAATTTGVYNVQVKDNNGCKGQDTTIISSLLPLPAAFLPADTAVCSYSTITLRPLNSYNSYLWNNNSTSPSITVSQPGLYWLQVRDNNNCLGKDTVLVNSKQCMVGFYIPTAFTPNHDGKNDVFRPLLFGNVKYYHFTVYNRWGQIVFDTPDLQKGWDGNLGDAKEGTFVFIWLCTYQFEGEERKVERGTVTLIR